ncbi:hypothetical protein DUNSADRAFT_6170 [Dunaliella salina]|uniref:Uncharacterized protein n=1 Tax=Dunaliella salina TaxID=3046 RepID=A0ABQ7GNX0_DUNSA|nr:hypothetical protein DUNSADRAFT_6170 [Dunaliella salina]|eukprot:KAF5836293.1 hypothetical protein DUNSADRAFT_6170 [Dunaliella salina]
MLLQARQPPLPFPPSQLALPLPDLRLPDSQGGTLYCEDVDKGMDCAFAACAPGSLVADSSHAHEMLVIEGCVLVQRLSSARIAGSCDSLCPCLCACLERRTGGSLCKLKTVPVPLPVCKLTEGAVQAHCQCASSLIQCAGLRPGRFWIRGTVFYSGS